MKLKQHYRKIFVGLFVLIFAVIGLYLLKNSLAAGADFNNDGKVDILDLSILASNYNKTGQTNSSGDADLNGTVDILDLSILASNWGSVVTPPASQQNWYAVRPTYLTDAQAKNKVVHLPELRSANAAANAYVPTSTELTNFYNAVGSDSVKNTTLNPLLLKVTGKPGLTNPSTDDLIQWTAWKWGIPEDIIRSVMVKESQLAGAPNWDQSAKSQLATVSTAWYNDAGYATSRVSTSDVFQSIGVMQIKWRPDGSRNPGTNVLRYKSTAFNLDYWAATVRYFYDGLCPTTSSSSTAVVCSPSYSAGQTWPSINAWYNPSPWNAANQSYVSSIQTILNNKPWTQTGF